MRTVIRRGVPGPARLWAAVLAIFTAVAPLHAACPGFTLQGTKPSAGSIPFHIASGDFNGDGKMDLVVTNEGGNNVSVLIGNGNGTFATKVNYNGGLAPVSVLVADLNGDNKPDLVVADSGQDAVSVLLNSGTGTFPTRVAYSVGSVPMFSAAGDFNGDGKIDLVVANLSTNNVSLLLGNGNGTFGAATNFSVGVQPVAIAAGDFNGDGKLDFVTANRSDGTVSVRLGNGDGTFGGILTATAGTQPFALTTADLNGDGKLDVIVGNHDSQNVSVLLGNGNGTFAPAVNYDNGNYSYSVAVADFNNDGKLDIASDCLDCNTIDILTGNGDGTFSATSAQYSVGGGSPLPYFVVAADFNGDGGIDLATANYNTNNVSVLLNGCSNLPTISTISPNGGPSAGAQSVVITGTNLSSITSVTFGGTPATITNNTGTTVTVTTPAHAAGAVNVVVTKATGSATSTNGYTYSDPPTVSSISPVTGSSAGGQTGVVITGTNLSTATGVTFGGTAATITNATTTTVTVTTPAHAAGAVDVAVTTPGGSATLTAGFTYLPAPAINSVTPNAGPTTGGQTGVIINGTNIGGATSVTFGGTAATITNNTATDITVTTPAHAAGTISVVVTVPAGSVTATNAYRYAAPPAISSLSPTSGPAGGGQSVTINGTNLSLVTSVTFGGVAATIGTNSGIAVSVTTPVHAAGAVDVVVTNAGGTVTSTNGYTYVAAPIITSVAPSAGPTAGGQTGVVITGTNLSSATSVKFATTNSTITNNTGTTITVTTPAHAAGAVNVVVATAGGTATSTNGYTYVAAPTITTISPNTGPTAGGQTGVVISGTNLSNATSVTFGGTAATITNNTAGSVTVTTPAHAAGAVNVVVTTAGGSATSANGYTYVTAPALTTVSPNTGPAAGGQTGVVISGTNLSGATSVTFGGTPATTTNNTAGTVTVTTPAHAAGAVDVAVTTAGGIATVTSGYTYVAAPTLTTVSPNSGPIAGGQTGVVISGTNLSGATSVTFGGTPATITNNTAGNITVTTPAHAAGGVDVVVTTGGGTGTATNGYTYAAPPTVTDVSPNSGPVTGGQTVSISGTALANATSVTFGGSPATITGNTAGTIQVTTPVHAIGAVSVVVTTAGGTASGSYTYVAGAAVRFVVFAPASATAGTPITFTVTALDAFDNTANGYTGTVHFTSSDGTATLPADSTLSGGSGSFGATLRTTGVQTITATGGAVTGTSNAITVAAGTATHFAIFAPASTIAGSPLSFTVTALDASNNTATGYSGTVHFISSDGTATLPADSMLTNGVGTFSATLRVAGSQTISATDGPITGTSNAISVAAAAATHFTVSAPASVTAGTAFTVTVTALDAFNNAAAGYAGTIHFTSSDGTATLPADSTLTSGVGTFSATLRTAGSQTIAATDGPITGTSNAINVAPATATHFTVPAPASATAGNTFNVTVTALDTFNNTATGYTGTVHFTSSDSTATLPSNSTLTTGTGTFNATLRIAGTQIITAADGPITGTSNTINVVPSAATHFVVSAAASTTAGNTFSLTVTALDALNNTATGYAGTAHFTSSDGTATLPADSPLTNGFGTFNATLRIAGLQTISATDGPGAISGTSNAIVVAPAATTHFAVSAPASATAGASFSITVTALDAFNNSTTGYAGTAHFSSSDATAALPADSTLTSGIGTFNATLRIAGSQTITATDGSVTGISNAINVAPAAAMRFSVSAPGPATAGSSFILTVTALDAFNNTVTTYAGTAHFTSSDGSASLPADSTLTNGAGTFSATLRLAGPQTITATDGPITGTSNAIIVAPAAATHFTVPAPGSVTAGTTFSVTVTALDAFENTAAGYAGTVHFTSSDGTATLPPDSALSNGVGTFSATLRVAGPQTITATDGPITGTSNAIIVASAGATHFAVSAPGSTTAGSGLTFTVTALDAFGNTASAYAGTAHFTSSDGTASLPSNSTLTNGTGTFSATLRTTGSQTITASDGPITGTSNAIIVAPAAATHFMVTAPASTTAGNAFSLAVTALDAFDNTASGYTGSVHFTSSDGTASLPSNSTLTNGTGTFSATLRVAGSQTIAASDGPGAISGTSNAIVVAPAAATHFTVSAPAAATAGIGFSLTVTALDAFNNIATGYTGTAHFTSSDGTATLSPNSTLTNGLGNFSATLRTAGSQTISTTDGPGAISGTSNAIIVAPAAATHFAVSAPPSAIAGNAFSVTVTALDAFNNTATGYTGTAHFTSSDGSATLPADSTLTNGAGTFNATLRVAGSQTITATDGPDAISGTSNAINVAPAGATHFAVSAPGSTTAGIAISVTVTALDAFNNVATGYAGTVHFTSSDGAATLPSNSTLTNGIGTFSAILRAAGSQTITATDGPITGTSNTIGVAAAATTHFTVSAPASETAGNAFNITVTALDAFNNTATGYAGTVHFTSTDPAASLSAGSTLTNGTGTFSATLHTSGARTITATDGTITGTSGTIDVSASTATHFAISAPVSGIAGAPFSVTVTALDAFDNPATGYSGSVHLTSSDGQASLPADGPPATVSATLRTAGSQTITAADGSITGTSNPISVAPSVATRFAVSAPSPATAGSAFPFTVTARDAFENTVTGYSGTVHFTSSDAAATLAADSTLTNGTGTFNATLKTAGSQTLTASDGTITGTSNAITVAPALAAHFVVTAPASTTAGSSFSVTVTALDAFNNPATGYAGTTHFTSGDSAATLPPDSALANGAGTFSAAMRTAGAQTIAATDGTITGTSNVINVAPAAATHFIVSAPSTATAGSAFNFTVTALDAFNNLATSYAGTGHFTSSDGAATLPAGSTLTGGTGSFSATLRTVGTRTITVTDGAVAGDSNAINVGPGPTTHFILTATASATAGTPLSFTVTALDAFNNSATAYAGTAHFTSSDANATLPADTTLISGTGSFNATLRIAGSQTISAADGSIAGTSNTINVAPGPATHFIVAAPASTVAGSSFSFTVTALDAFNNTASAYAGTAHFTSSDAAATLPGDTTLTNGIGTPSATLRTAGGQTISAVDGAVTGVSKNITVAPSSITHFGVLAPTAATAGIAFTFTVAPLDAFDNTVSGYSGTVHFTSSDSNASLPADAVPGTFMATLRTAGSQTITATAGAITGTSNSIDAAPAIPTGFLLSAPAPATAGSAFTFTVAAHDAFNNVTPSYAGSVHFTSSDAQATLPADSVLTGGSGSFNVTLRTTGSQTLSAADGALTGGATVTVNTAGADRFTVEASTGGNIATQTAGVPFAIRITARDSFGNIDSGYAGTVTLAANGSSITPLTIAFAAADGGVKIVNATVTQAGNGRTITASSSAGSGTSAPFAVGAGALHHFRVEAAGGGAIGAQTANVPFAVQITALDANDNVVTTFNSSTAITSTGLLLSGGGSTASFTNGLLATHVVSLGTTGSQTITATSGTIAGTSNAFTVSAVADIKVTLNGSTSTLPGTQATYTIVVQNAGPSVARAPVVSLALPDNWLLHSATTSCGSLPCTLADIAPSTNVVIQIAVSVPQGAGSDTPYAITAGALSTTPDPSPANNQSTAHTLVPVVACPLPPSGLQPAGGVAPAKTGTLRWAANGAGSYQVYFGAEGSGCATLAGETSGTSFDYHDLIAGKRYEWRVVAQHVGCPAVSSSCVTFEAANECPAPSPIVLGTVAEISSGAGYHVTWNDVGAGSYELQEAADISFANAQTISTTGHSAPFLHDAATATPYFYRVRTVIPCLGQRPFTAEVRVVVQPRTSNDGSTLELMVENGGADVLSQAIHLAPPAGAKAASSPSTFIATADQPWLVINPPSGSIPPSGLDVMLTVSAAGRQIGTSVATAHLAAADGVTIGDVRVNLNVGTMMTSQPRAIPIPANVALLPAVAHAAGASAFWQSDVRLFNPATVPLVYMLSFTPSAVDGTQSGRRVEVTVPAGSTVAFDDVVRHLFGFGAIIDEPAIGSLEVRPKTIEARAVVTSRTYAVTPAGTYGQAIPAFSAPNFAAMGTPLSLQNLAQSDAYRTNVGLVEASGHAATVRLHIYDAAGHELTQFDVSLAPLEQRQFNSLLADHGITSDNARIELDVTTPGSLVGAYASMVDNRTADPTLIPAVKPSLMNASRYVVPGVADFETGRNTWRTDVRIYNSSNTPVIADLILFAQGTSTTMTKQVTIAPAEVKAFDSILRSLFATSNTGGALHVVTPTLSNLIITARTYDAKGVGTYGQFIPAVTSTDATGIGERDLEILHLEQSASYRANIGFVEVAGKSAQVQVTATLADGRTASSVLNLGPYEFLQIGSMLQTLGFNTATNARLTLRVIGGSGRVTGYASIIDNRTGDPTYMQAQ